MATSSKPSPIPIFRSPPMPSQKYRSLSFSSASPLYSCSSRASLERSASLGSTEIPNDFVMNMSSKTADDDVHGWLEAMRASSPRTDCCMAQISNGICEEAETQYTDWIQEHPSALGKFNEIMESASGKQVAVFLDYDGTLSQIVEDPDQAFITEAMRDTVKDVASHFPTAIVTGRNRDKVFEFVCLPELYYAGSHGMDIMGPVECCHGIKADAAKVKDYKVYNTLCERAQQFVGARVEHNKFCITLHFRCVKEERWSALAEEVQKVLQTYPNLSLTKGRKVLELRPEIEWHKGRALEFLLDALGLDCPTNVLPVYIGDDRTDEDAFKVLREKKYGCSILVSNVPKDTTALYSLQDPQEVMEFLQQLVIWKEKFPQ